LPPSAWSRTFESIGTVVCALTTLLAAPTAVEMSFVEQVNFIVSTVGRGRSFS
jgi:hypothetical protein